MLVSRQNYRTHSIKVYDHTFKRVRNFKYLRVQIEDANSHEEVIRRFIAENTDTYVQVKTTIKKIQSNLI